MKKVLLTITLIVTLLLSSFSFALTDIKGHWASDYINTLVLKGAIKGYPDDSFKPQNTIKVGEFTKILVNLLGEDVGNAKSGHWASLYLDEAKKKGLILKDENEFVVIDVVGANEKYYPCEIVLRPRLSYVISVYMFKGKSHNMLNFLPIELKNCTDFKCELIFPKLNFDLLKSTILAYRIRVFLCL